MSKTNTPDPRDYKPGSDLGHTLRLLLVELLFETVAPAFVIALLINLYVAQSTYVHGTSMEPNLHTDQRLIMEKVSYRLHPPHRGDIVVIDVDTSDIPLIKRVIGLPGETVEVKNELVYIDGTPLQEPYIAEPTSQEFPSTVVPEGHYFVMGDNRNHSNDSRSWGPLPGQDIIGRAWLTYWPFSDWHVIRGYTYALE